MIRHDPQKAAYKQGCKDTIERIADELLRLSDSYINHWKAADAMEFGDIWTWTAELSRMVRAGELTAPLPQEPPF